MDEETLIEEAEAVSIIDIRQDPQYAAELIVRLATALREWAGLDPSDPDMERADRFHAGSTEADYDFGPASPELETGEQ